MRGFRDFLKEQLQDPKVKREYDALEAEYSAKQAILCNAEAALKKTLEYKGYIGTIEYSEDDAAFFGKVTGIQALLSYEGCDETSLVADFHNVIDEYLEMCRERGLVPANLPIDISELSNDQLNAELEKGYADIAAGRTRDASSVFSDIRKDYGI